MLPVRRFIPTALFGALLLLGATACEKKLSPEAQQALDSAKNSDARVAALEKELAELKGSKPGDPDAEEVSKGHVKAIEKQLAEAKKSAETKKKAAQELAAKPAPSETPKEAPKPAPKPVVLELPAGTKLDVKLAKELSTATVQAGDSWEGTLASEVVVNGRVAWPQGTEVRGVVSQSTPAGRLSSGNGGLGIKLTFVGTQDVDSGIYLVSGTPRGERNAKYIGGAAALGALVGILSDKKNKGDHALGGAAVGAAAGTAVAAATADTVIKMPSDKPVAFVLSAPTSVTLKP